MGESSPLMEQEEQITLQHLASLENLHGRRARALLALAEGSTQSEAGRQAELSPGQVGYALSCFRRRRLGMFPQEVLDGAKKQTVQQDSRLEPQGTAGPEISAEISVVEDPWSEGRRSDRVDRAEAEAVSNLPAIVIFEAKAPKRTQKAKKKRKNRLGDHLKFEISNGSDEQQLLAELTTDYTLKSEPSTLIEQHFYDTFDWRLFNHALALSVSGHELYLSQLSSGKIVRRAEISEPPTFAWDCPTETFKEKLASVIGVRALLKLAEVRVRTSPYRVLNKKNKTVAWIGYEAVEQPQPHENSPLLAYVWLRPVRGYPKHSRRLRQRCQALGLTQVSPTEVYQHILAEGDKRPGDYSTELRFQFEPEMRSDEAAKTLLRFLLTIMQRNEPMIKQDIDTEFLHDFRVAVRRARAALGQIKGVFPAETTKHFRQAFKQIGQMTNELRDLDVSLLSQERYQALLPASLGADIDPLFDYLSQKRTQALKEVIQALEQPGYSQTLEAWETFLSAPPSDDPGVPNAGRPIKALAQERIYKSYQRMVKLGNQILENTADDKLHTLRIEGKKLRYLMEFFAGLFPPQEMNELIKQLKELQNILGDFNDLGVQETYLLQVAEEMPLPQPQSRKVFLCIGALVDALAREREAVKASFATTFANFAAPANRKAMRALFVPKK